jgi:hypothetical protein
LTSGNLARMMFFTGHDPIHGRTVGVPFDIHSTAMYIGKNYVPS